ncbi:hypothetical protein AJ80_09104 [Polytolypa hystricis UAMH7299]|uniref:Uncharacterized protein n=1 Tax=Polytolypa hystricis (strain UAMH7299) TaxID=1447883 RepID=A0A2B7WWI1_POLH7|nr:hypothetical protein AJ80_09104 [Polytolypa hystricis UAMH7299]
MFSHTAINPPGNGTALPSAASQPQQQAQMAGNNNNDNDTPSSASQKQPLALPAVPSPDTNSPPQQQIDMSNGLGTVKLDHLGPLVVNVDGSLSRIGNWEQMTDIERRNTLRIVGKRNQARLKVLRETGASGEGGKKE